MAATSTPRVAKPAETGVFYAPEDVAGLVRRIFVVAVDLTVVFLLCMPVVCLHVVGVVSSHVLAASALLVGWAYLGCLKATKFPTLGYRLAHVELVDLQGARVTLWQATIRFLFLFLTLGNLIDLVLLSHDADRQTLRDKLVGTCVIRRGARPVGSGPITYSTYFVGGWSIVFREVWGFDDSGNSVARDGADSA